MSDQVAVEYDRDTLIALVQEQAPKMDLWAIEALVDVYLAGKLEDVLCNRIEIPQGQSLKITPLEDNQ